MNHSYKKFFLFLFWFFSYLLAFNISDKQNAVFEFLSSYNISSERLDHFVGYDGKEYVLVYSLGEPFCLLVFNIDKEKSLIKVEVVSDNQTIEDVLYKRASYNELVVENVGDFLKKLLPTVDKYVEDLKLKELKYSFLLGLDNSSCSSVLECKEVCLSSSFCSQAYKYNSSELIDNILEFSETKKAFSTLIDSEKIFRQKLNNYTDREILDYYLNFFEKLNHYSLVYSSLKIQSKDSIVYAGELVGPYSLLNQSYLQLNIYYDKFLKNTKFKEGIEKIKRNSLLFKKEESKQESQTELLYTSEENPTIVFKSLEENTSESKKDLNISNAAALDTKNTSSNTFFSQIDLILTIVALAIVLYAIFKVVLTFILKKTSDFNNKNTKKEFFSLSKFFGRKKERTLEDL